MARFIKVENKDILYSLKRNQAYKMEAELMEFINMGCKYAEWHVNIPEEYKNLEAAYSTAYGSNKRFGYPIKVHKVNGKIYFERTDM